MEHRKILPAVFAGAGGCLAVLALVICLTQRNAEPRILVYPQGAAECAEGFLDSVCAGDFQAASQYLWGEPSLDIGTLPETSKYLWNAFVSSLSYQLNGGCYAAASGVARDVTVTGLDMEQLLQAMKRLAPQVLEEQVNRAEDMDAVYDADREYREAFILSVMYQTARTALAETAPVSRALTLKLLYDGGWRVVPNSALLRVLSGGILE